jgi:hypothetical protein
MNCILPRAPRPSWDSKERQLTFSAIPVDAEEQVHELARQWNATVTRELAEDRFSDGRRLTNRDRGELAALCRQLEAFAGPISRAGQSLAGPGLTGADLARIAKELDSLTGRS